MRTAAFLCACSVVVAVVARGDSLSMKVRDGEIRVDMARMDLLRGPVLTQLRNGKAVAFDFHLALWTGTRTNIRRRTFERFVVSYDLWEEKFAVTTLRKPRANARGLTTRQVEVWCLEHLAMPSPDLAGEQVAGARLDVRTVESGRDVDLFGGEGLNLTGLIELLSRPARKDEVRWSFESAALRVSEMSR